MFVTGLGLDGLKLLYDIYPIEQFVVLIQYAEIYLSLLSGGITGL